MGNLRVSMPSEEWEYESELRNILANAFGNRLGASIKDPNNPRNTTFQYVYTNCGFAECIYNERELSMQRIQELLAPIHCIAFE